VGLVAVELKLLLLAQERLDKEMLVVQVIPL
jgi:hypothetical protein